MVTRGLIFVSNIIIRKEKVNETTYGYGGDWNEAGAHKEYVP